ncbi:MAG TPA: rod shape-determining protein MreC [Chthonomonadaceae bacterium]|nr:rod shape-determining protein MreC [Chthonomonadaceae bacterium]
MHPTPFLRRYAPALAFLLLGISLGAWHNRATDRGRPDRVAGAVRSVIVPPAALAGQMSRWIQTQTGWFFHGSALAAENRRLRAQIGALQAENASLQEEGIENTRLRADLGFQRAAPYRLLPAEVAALRPDPQYDTLLLSRGSRDGVRPSGVVVAPAGLVGRVLEVSPDTASVLLLTDPNSSVGARVQRAASRALGICKGDGAAQLTMTYLAPDADVQPGDRILTSGLGGVFPAGLSIGVVTAVRLDPASGLKTAAVKPSVDFDRLDEVYARL